MDYNNSKEEYLMYIPTAFARESSATVNLHTECSKRIAINKISFCPQRNVGVNSEAKVYR